MDTMELDEEEKHLAIAAEILFQDGKEQAAALLLDVQEIRFGRTIVKDWGDGCSYTYGAWIVVEAHLLDRFSQEVRELVREALAETTREVSYYGCDELFVLRALPEPNRRWRERLEAQLQGDVSNQAKLRALPPAHPAEDHLGFRSQEELSVYRALKAKQAELPLDGTILIAPNPGVRLRENTSEVDFLVTYKGRAGVIEVDGPHHKRTGRYAADKSKDQLMEDAGISYVLRIAVEETTSPEELSQRIDRLLAKLTGR